MLNELKRMMEGLLRGDTDALLFSQEAPLFLLNHFEEVEEENEGTAELLNDELPDICDSYERGDNPGGLIEKVKALYERI